MFSSPVELKALAALATDRAVTHKTVQLVCGILPEIHETIKRAQAGREKKVTKAYISLWNAQVATGVEKHWIEPVLSRQALIGFKVGVPGAAIGVDPSQPGSGRGIASRFWIDQDEMERLSNLRLDLDISGFDVSKVVEVDRCYTSLFLRDILHPLGKTYPVSGPTRDFILSSIAAFGGMADFECSGPTVSKFMGVNRINGWKICNEMIELKLMQKKGRKFVCLLASLENLYTDTDDHGCEKPVDKLEAVEEDRRGWLAGKAEPPVDKENPRYLKEGELDWAVASFTGGIHRRLTRRAHHQVARMAYTLYASDQEEYSNSYWRLMWQTIKELSGRFGVLVSAPLPPPTLLPSPPLPSSPPGFPLANTESATRKSSSLGLLSKRVRMGYRVGGESPA